MRKEIALYSRKEKKAMTEPTCPDCDGNGVVFVDIGGGNTRKQFCDCEIGQELVRQAEGARQARIDIKVDEQMYRKKFGRRG